jgi:tetratricopeptide (TPR) repeat protein
MIPLRFPAIAALFAACLALPPAHGQGVKTSLELEGQRMSLTGQEMAALTELGRQVQSANRSAQDVALAKARQAAEGRDARHVLAVYMLEIGRQRHDDALNAEALDILIASELTSKAKLPGFLDMRAGIAFNARDFGKAKALWTRLLELKPNDPDTLGNLAQASVGLNDRRGAADLLGRAIAARQATGQPVSEKLFRQRLSLAQQNGLVEPGIAAAHGLLAAYPTAENRRAALVVYRQLAAPAGAIEIDLLRLMRTLGALNRTDEYQRMAQLLRQAGLATEAKAVLDEGLARRLLDAGGSPTREIIAEVDREIPRERGRLQSAAPSPELADSLLGARRYAEAAALYRAALAKGGANAAQLNTRLGMALVLAGRRGEAEAAFRAAAADTGVVLGKARYADLAKFWLAWLAQPESALPQG